MIVISLTNGPMQLRGYLTRFLSEAQAGLFVGEVSARVRDLLWDRICSDLPQGSGRAMLAYDMDNEQGYVIQYFGGERRIVDLDGLQVVGIKKKTMTEPQDVNEKSDERPRHWSNAYWRRRR